LKHNIKYVSFVHWYSLKQFISVCSFVSCTASKSLLGLFLCSVVRPQNVYHVCSCVQLYSLKRYVKCFFMCFSCTTWENLSSVCSWFSCTPGKKCLLLCSIVQPEKIYCHTDPCPVWSYVQLYSLKKSIATLIRALSEENPPDVNEEEAQSLSGVSTLKMFVYKFCSCTQNCLARYV